MTYLVRRAVAELLGTAFLVASVVGSGVMASRLSPGDVGLQLLENSLATAGALMALIIAFGSVSAAFNPVVTMVEVARGNVWLLEGVALVIAQLAGGVLGAIAANLMFDLPAVAFSSHHRATPAHLFAEVVATIGLLLVIHGALRRTHLESIAVAVAGYIAAAYWFTSSTSFANPAVTVARMLSDTFSGIAPASVLPFIGAQIVGGILGYLLIAFLHPEETS
ncbi:MAG TPA: aquaporin [Nocardioides sp.]|nr:aquaporin [Nocardioides sp.]